ncbi:MAG: PrpR N-terminal domain-containing protein [Clostridiales bacterium]|nr:PrpR N-terminal domain-containing protein [Clostridiales bacterium]
MGVEYTQTEAVEARAIELEQQGCKLIVARGVQAQLIKRCVKLPVAEIHVTAQELGGLILQIRRELGVNCPKVGLVGFANMMCDTSQFNELFSVELMRYMVTDVNQLRRSVDQARAEGCQAVIGGDMVCLRAGELGMVYRFIPSGEESMRNALDLANQICYAIDLELSNSAEMNTMLDFTFSGIMQVKLDGTILRANRMAFNLLNVRPQEMTQRNVLEVLPQLSQKILDRALKQGEETYASLLPIQQKAVVVNVAPILIEGESKGGILTFQEGKRIIEMDSELRRELYQRGYIAQFNFDKFVHNGSNQPSTANVRIIASSDVNLIVQVEKGEFRSDLYYALNVLSLDVPPLRSRREAILNWVNYYLRQWQDRCKRCISLTQGAQDFLENYDWPGNLNQVSSVCERIVLLAEKRSVDEVFLRRQMEQVAPKVLHGTEQVVLFKDQKAVQIAELLRKHNGNRQRVADEMGISKTTLWRYMKKYGIEKDYSY